MSVSFLTPSRTVVLITDDALCVYSTSVKGVRLVETVPWEAENFERNVANILAKDCGGRPVMILNDMVEISFRKERIPKVGLLDKKSVVQRKLNLAFPNYPARAALPLKEKIAKTDKTVASSVYIFAASPASPALTKTVNAVSRSLAPVAGFGLLPAESADLVKTLHERQQSKNKNAWAIFIGQHSHGGLRQIVVRNGELALTRMTPAADMNSDPRGWLRDVTQEFRATMSYLTRFGYTQDAGLSVFMIANKDAGDAFEETIGVPCTYSSLTVAEVAKTLGLSLGRGADNNYAENLHVAWAGRKSKLLMPMRAQAIEAISQPRQSAALISLVLFAGAAFLGYQSFNQYYAAQETQQKIDAAQERKAQLDVQYEKEVQRKKDLGFNVELVQSSLAVFDNYEEHNIRLLKMFWGVGNALGRDLKVDKINIERIPDEPAENAPPSFTPEDPNAPPTKPKTPYFSAAFQMSFPSTTDALKGNAEVSSFRDRIQQLLPDNTVTVTKFLKDYGYTNQITVETGDAREGADATQDFIAEITVKGVAP